MIRVRAALSAALALVLTFVGASPARADDPLPITVAEVTPAHLPSADATISVTGEFTNTGTEPLADVQARVAHATTPLTSFDDVAAALADDDPPMSRRAPEPPLNPDEPLEAGQSIPFTLRVPASEVDVAEDEIATIITVEFVTAGEDDAEDDVAGAEPTTVASTALLLPHEAQPFEVSDAQLITALPSMQPGFTAVDDAFGKHLGDRLLPRAEAALAGDGALLLDPAVHAAATSLAERKKQPNALRLLEIIGQLAEEERVQLLPHGNPNLARLPDALRGDVAQWARELAPEPLAEAPLAALVRDPAVVPEGFDEVYLVGGDDAPRLFRAVPDAGPTPLDDLTELPADGIPGADSVWDEVGAAIDDIAADDDVREEFTTPEGQEPYDLRPLYLSAFNSSFTAEDEGLAELQSSHLAQFAPSKISLIMSPQFVMGERMSEFPATIRNPNQVAIHVKIAFESDNPVRIQIPDSAWVRVRGGESQTLLVQPKAASNGVTTVYAELVGRDGTKVGEPVPIEVTATEFGRVGWIIVIASGVVVLGGTVWRIRKVRSERMKEERESGQ